MALAKAAMEAFRRIDVLVNNSGILKEAPIGLISNEDIRMMIDANPVSVINMTQVVSRVMGRQKSGSVVNLTSIMGLRGRPGQLVYSATKAPVNPAQKKLWSAAFRWVGPEQLTTWRMPSAFLPRTLRITSMVKCSVSTAA